MKPSTFLLICFSTLISAVAHGDAPATNAAVTMMEQASPNSEDRVRRDSLRNDRRSDSTGSEKSDVAEEKTKTNPKPLPSRAHVWLT